MLENANFDLAGKREILAPGVQEDRMQALLEARECEAEVFDVLHVLSEDRLCDLEVCGGACYVERLI